MNKVMVLALILVFWGLLPKTALAMETPNLSTEDWKERVNSCSQKYRGSSEENFKKFVNCVWMGVKKNSEHNYEKLSFETWKYVGEKQKNGLFKISQRAVEGMVNKGCDPGSSWRKEKYWACWSEN